MITIISVEEAIAHLILDITLTDVVDLQAKIGEASQITFDYYKVVIPEQTSPLQDSPTYDLWANNSDAIPGDVKAYCKLVLGTLWAHREADADVNSEALQRLGRMRRKPSMA